MKFVRYNGQIAAIVKSGQELVVEMPESDLDDHLGLWFGEFNDEGRPIVHTIPAKYADESQQVFPIYQH